MIIHVFGQIENGPIQHRAVTLIELVRAWGPFAREVLRSRADHPMEVGPRRVWVQIERFH